MLNKSLSYKALLRIVGLLLIAAGLYFALQLAFMVAGENIPGTLIMILGPLCIQESLIGACN